MAKGRKWSSVGHKKKTKVDDQTNWGAFNWRYWWKIKIPWEAFCVNSSIVPITCADNIRSSVVKYYGSSNRVNIIEKVKLFSIIYDEVLDFRSFFSVSSFLRPKSNYIFENDNVYLFRLQKTQF